MATDTPSRETELAQTPARCPATPSRWRLRLIVFVAGLASFVAALPTLASRTPLGNVLLRILAREAKLNGSLAAGGLSVGWFSPLAARDVELRDAEGKLLAKAASVAMDKTLWALLRHRTEPGGIKLEHLELEIVLRDDGSNLEDVFSAWLPFGAGVGADRIDCALEIVDGQAVITDALAERSWKIEPFKIALQSPGATADPVKLVVSGALPGNQPPGDFSLAMRLGGEQPSEVRFDATAWPLEVAQPLLRRVAPGSAWTGRLDAQLHYHAGAAPGQQLLEGEAVASEFALAGPWLGAESLKLSKVELPYRLDWKGDHLTIDELGVACDAGELTCYATLADSKGLSSVRSLRELLELAARSDGEITGQLDLAKLAKLLPGTLRIREGTEITSGEIKLALTGRQKAADPDWQGTIEATRLVAEHEGKELAWEQPLSASFKAHSTEQGPVFDQLTCESDFLKLEGSGTLDAFTLSGTHDLAKLTAQLTRFVDLGGAQVAGAGKTRLDCRRQPGDRFQVEAEVEIDGFSLVRPGGWQSTGECNGQGELQFAANGVSASGNLLIANFVARAPSGATWTEPQLKLLAEASYDKASDALEIARVQLNSVAAEIDARGKIAGWSKEKNADIAGQATYDLAKLQGLVAAYTGNAVQLSGRETRPFSFAGPLSALGEGQAAALTKLTAQAELAWQSAGVYGTRLGPGEIQAELARGAVRFSPLDLPLSGGKVHLAPIVELSHDPAELSFASGRVVDQVQITPEMCNAGMKYALPILAEATEVQGRFSADLEGCQLPLANLGAGDAAGKIIVHSVVVGPGALTRELAPVIAMLAEALGAKGSMQPLGSVALSRESQIDVRLVQGRVYHRGLELAFPDVTVRTYGSVGLDESLAIMAEAPVPSKWIGNNALGQSLAGQTIRLPIAGTLHQPKIDAREVQRLAGRVVEDTAKGMLHKEIGRQLDKLFGPASGQP